LTLTPDIRVKCASAFFLDMPREMMEKRHTADQDGVSSGVQTAVTVLL